MQKRSIFSIRSHIFAIGKTRRATVLREHREILDAARRRDPDAAAEIIEHHVRGSAQAFLANLRTVGAA